MIFFLDAHCFLCIKVVGSWEILEKPWSANVSESAFLSFVLRDIFFGRTRQRKPCNLNGYRVFCCPLTLYEPWNESALFRLLYWIVCFFKYNWYWNVQIAQLSAQWTERFQGLHHPQRAERLREKRGLSCKEGLCPVQHPRDHNERKDHVYPDLWCDVLAGVSLNWSLFNKTQRDLLKTILGFLFVSVKVKFTML